MELIKSLVADYPEINFKASDKFYWSPKNKTVYFGGEKTSEVASWSLLHELSHGLLNHQTYNSDFELLQLEVEAWEEAKRLATKYQIIVSEDHIQDCLDTYRDWLHRRSACPTCKSRGLQIDSKTYECSQCDSKWRVSSARFCRPYRKIVKYQPPLLKTASNNKTIQFNLDGFII